MRSEERRGKGRERGGKEEGGKNAERGGEIERIHDVGHLKKREGEGEEERGRRGREMEKGKKRDGFHCSLYKAGTKLECDTDCRAHTM